MKPCPSGTQPVKDKDVAKHVELRMDCLRTRVRFPPPPPNTLEFMMRVEVTQENIDDAWTDSRGYCPIALGVQEAIGCKRIEVTNDQIRIIYQDHPADYDAYVTPLDVRKFTYMFAKHGPKAVKPFEFELKEYA